MRFLRYYLVIASATLIFFHSYSLITGARAIALMRATGMSYDGSLEVQLFNIHLGLWVLSLAILISCIREWSFGIFTALTSNLAILGVYTWWYREKYTFLSFVYGLKPGSYDYETWLSEIGIFRGAAQADYCFLGLTATVAISTFLWAALNLRTRFRDKYRSV